MFIKILRPLIPKKIRSYLREKIYNRNLNKNIQTHYIYDMDRNIKFNFKSDLKSLDYLLARITIRFHSIEKGLALANPRIGFGRDKIKDLMSLIKRYNSLGFSMDNLIIQSSLKVLEEYSLYNEKNGQEVSDIKKFIASFEIFEDSRGGSSKIIAKEVKEKSKGNFEELVNSRHSIRNFSERDVDINILNQSIRLAQTSPSSCNRQSGRVYVIKEPSSINKALNLLTGFKAFENNPNKLLAVASNINGYNPVTERNQPLIDGSLFSMTLVHALHFNGLATCTLNWSVDKMRDMELRNELKINDDDLVLFFIAVGHYPDRINIAQSQRKSLEEISFQR